jgi:uncharacterized HAD superfamily protein/adenine/guanine phosphoribosyltransferase-like PRPP-binding protein
MLKQIKTGLFIIRKEGLAVAIREIRTWYKITNRFKKTNTQMQARIPVGQKFTWKTYEDLVNQILQWDIGSDYDIIIGIPRSGLIIASILATKYGKPLSTPDMFQKGKYWVSDCYTGIVNTGKILLVDDSCSSGSSILKAKQIIGKCTTACIYAPPGIGSIIDISLEKVSAPNQYEWSISHQPGSGVGNVAMDMDGVICEDCYTGNCDDEKYANWLDNAKPLIIPCYKLKAIISNRLAKYKKQTVKWLKDHNVRYDNLYLWDIEKRPENIDLWTAHKVNALKGLDIDLLYESDPYQSSVISEKCKIPVICMSNKKLYQL